MGTFSKIILSRVLVGFGVDALFRYLNRNKLLVIMYHGVTLNTYNPPVWTHLPVDKFRQQLQFLNNKYSIVAIDQVLDALNNNVNLPPRAALLTFDDGYKNNLKVAFPVLQEMNLPATIFLTVDKIGSKEPLWFDELYLLLHAKCKTGLNLPFINQQAANLFKSGKTWEAYCVTVEDLKISSEDNREKYLQKLRNIMVYDDISIKDDFSLLDWNDVIRMRDTGLVSFGVHTASHRILSELKKHEWEQEIGAPRRKLERLLDSSVKAFCFPNGRPGVDFKEEHISYLKECGYLCSFTTRSDLCKIHAKSRMQIGRIAAGNDITSDYSFFRLNSSGFLPFCRKQFSFNS